MQEQNQTMRVLCAIDLGAHAARMLIAQCPGKDQLDILEDFDVTIPLGTNVFHTGSISASSIRILCEIFRNFRKKMDEYGVTECRAIATSAVREAANSEILIERIKHETGIELQLYEGADEARLNYLSVIHTLPKRLNFHTKKAMIADIGTGACQISTYDKGSMTFTETLKIGTLRILETIPGATSVAALRESMMPTIDNAFSDLIYSGVDFQGDMVISTGASVRMLFRIFMANKGHKELPPLYKVTKDEFDDMLENMEELSIGEISSRHDIRQELAEAVLPCALLVRELFRITKAKELLIPMVSLKMGLMLDFANSLLAEKDEFEQQTLGLVRSIACKYRCDSDFFTKTEENAIFLFRKMQKLHGLTKRHLLLLRIAAILHKCGLFLNNQAYHKHSAYIISATEIPGISLSERLIVSQTARYQRKGLPQKQHTAFQSLPQNDRNVILKLSSLLRIACILSNRGITPDMIQIRQEKDRIIIRNIATRTYTDGNTIRGDLEYFFYTFAVELILQ
ncbi:MAG: hypothetical protein IKB16_00125 [Lentisphaeria bacterium]|nr:hypothetical protein [Lentisphaeria bacterium]